MECKCRYDASNKHPVDSVRESIAAKSKLCNAIRRSTPYMQPLNARTKKPKYKSARKENTPSSKSKQDLSCDHVYPIKTCMDIYAYACKKKTQSAQRDISNNNPRKNRNSSTALCREKKKKKKLKPV